MRPCGRAWRARWDCDQAAELRKFRSQFRTAERGKPVKTYHRELHRELHSLQFAVWFAGDSANLGAPSGELHSSPN